MPIAPRSFVDPSDISGALGDFTSARTAMTAFAGGGQANAVLLTAAVNRVNTVATAGDSVRLPPAVTGAQVTVFNKAAVNAMNVFPATGESINALAANTALSVVVTKGVIFTCLTPGIWDTILGA